MNNEIKEILNQLEIVARKHTIEVCEDISKIETMPASVVEELRLNNYSSKLLLDYITNLQEENKKLKDDKAYAIGYIKNNYDNFSEVEVEKGNKKEIIYVNNFNIEHLLYILGGDKE